MSKSSELLARTALARDASPAERAFVRGEGARAWDVDGTEYLDYALGNGALPFGHGHRAIDGAVAYAVFDGMLLGGRLPLEVEAAERLCATLGWAERVRFGSSEGDAARELIQLVRRISGHTAIVRISGGEPAWGDAAALAGLLADHAGDVAAVVVEPAVGSRAVAEATGAYLEQVRGLCSKHDVLLAFDEIETGLRLGPGGAAERYGVVPDLAVYGRALGGGWPVGALAGLAAPMDALAEEVYRSGTWEGCAMASAATLATLAAIEADPPYERIRAHGEALIAELPEAGARWGVPLAVDGLPEAFDVRLEDGSPLAAREGAALLLHAALADAGVWTTERGRWFPSAAHGEAELRITLARVERALEALRERQDAALA